MAKGYLTCMDCQLASTNKRRLGVIPVPDSLKLHPVPSTRISGAFVFQRPRLRAWNGVLARISFCGAPLSFPWILRANQTMLEKKKIYNNVRFSANTLREAIKVFRTQTDDGDDESGGRPFMIVKIDDSEWKYDSEDEFFANYRKSSSTAVFSQRTLGGELTFQVVTDTTTHVTVSARYRGNIEAVFEIFERDVDASLLPPPQNPLPVVFIGHGRNPQWRDLKDHLQDKHRYRVEAYEIGARTGHAIRGILEDMLAKTSFAVLVLTGEDQTPEGSLRARQNVIHEAGLFQGRLGFNRAIILLEGGTEEFSNIEGIEQIRFGTGNIKETFGEVLATLRREFV